MKRFVYKAKDRAGKLFSGEVEASSASYAAGLIRKKGLFVISVTNKSKSLLAFLNKGSDKVPYNDVVAFTRQLSTMINAGLPVTDSLLVLRNQTKGEMQRVVSEILTDVSEGDPLSKACLKHPKVFTSTYTSILKAGEAGGVVEKVLLRLAENMERESQFRSKVKGAMIYPAIVVVGMLVVMTVMMIFVVPKMTSLYTDLGATLPLPTRILMGISDAFLRFWPVVLILGGLSGYAFSVYVSSSDGRRAYDRFKLRIPIMGPLQRKIMLTDITRTLSLLISAGVSILESLNVVVGIVKNTVIKDALKDTAVQVEKGFPIAYAFAKHEEAFPFIVSQMTAVGEQTGKTDEVLLKVSQIFENESDQAVKALTTAIEPIIMIFLGLGVGFLVIAVILPIYNLTSELGV